MLKKRAPNLHELVWATAANVGNSAPRVAGEIISSAFPATWRCSQDEGADRIFRKGLIAEVKRILRSVGPDEEQRDFADIEQAFRPIVDRLKSRSYFVESADEYVSIPMLIAEPSLLEEAHKFMRKKGFECLAEADLLYDLYCAITEPAPRPAPAEGANAA